MRCLRHDCKAEFKPVRSNQVYCSPTCKREMERRQRVANKTHLNDKKEAYMEIKKGVQEVLTWDFSGLGLFETTLWDGKITDIRFCRAGSNLGGETLCASSGCEEFIKAVHEALGDVIKYLTVISRHKK